LFKKAVEKFDLSYALFLCTYLYVSLPILFKSFSFMKDHHSQKKYNKEKEFNSHSSGFSPLTGNFVSGVSTIC
jgi:hypothetical protein